jgi:16S rRNA processing protein RimM
LTANEQRVSAGRVGRPHGLDGSFYVEDAAEPLAEGAPVWIGGHAGVVERRAGTRERPLVRVRGIADRDAVAALRGERLVVPAGELAEGEYLAADLVRCEVPGLGRVRRVVATPSCDVLEVGDPKVLVPFVSDAIASVDLDAGVIEVDREFLGLDDADG